MTLGELSQLKHLKREIALDRQRLRQLEEAALPGAQVMTGMPHGTGVRTGWGIRLRLLRTLGSSWRLR